MCHYSLQRHFDLDKERDVFLRNVSNLQFQYRIIHRRLYVELLAHSLTRPAGRHTTVGVLNPLNPELNPICYLLALLGAHHFLHVSRIRVKLLTFRRLMSYIYGEPILDVSRSHTTTQHSR